VARRPRAPAAGPAPAAPPRCAVAPCADICPNVEIQINNTPAATDDVVALHWEHPDHRWTVNCRIRATATVGTPSTIVLTNPDGRLRFPDVGDTTVSLALPDSRAWVPFQISGEVGSDAVGDAVIEAHCGNAAGALMGTKNVTVFWFTNAQINLTPRGRYRLVGGTLTTTGGRAILHSAQAEIRPAGVNCAAPQIARLRIGIMQNGLAGLWETRTWGAPTIVWRARVPRGTTIDPAAQLNQTITSPVDANDSAPGVRPLYDRPGVPGTTLDPGSLARPIGCTSGRAATTFDTPSTPFRRLLTQPALAADGTRVGTLTYRNQDTAVQGDFLSWAVVFDRPTQLFSALRERGWHIDVHTPDGGVPQRVTVDAADREPTQDPIGGAPLANTIVNNAANSAIAPVDPAVTVHFENPHTHPTP
jgi:hypothetical protein